MDSTDTKLLKDKLPAYVKLQFISNHFNNDRNMPTNYDSNVYPDLLRMKKLNYLANNGYLGKNPGRFFDNNKENEDYLNSLLNLNIVADWNEIDVDSHFSSNFKVENRRESTLEGDGSYYIDGKINWNSKMITDDDLLFDHQTNGFPTSDDLKDLTMPYELLIPTKTCINYDSDTNVVSTTLLENNISNLNIYSRTSLNNSKSFITVQGNTFVTRILGIYYFEIEILNCIENDCDIGIGFIKEEIREVPINTDAMIDIRGTNEKAVGWHNKSGFVIWNDKRLEHKLPKFTKNDVIGVGYNFSNDKFFVTKNGLMIKEMESISSFFDKSFEGSKNVKGLIPAISLGSWCKVKPNLGFGISKENKFCFDINNYVKKYKYKVLGKLNQEKIIPFKLPTYDLVINDNFDMTKYIDKLVLNYLKYSGYSNTFKKLQQDLLDMNKINEHEKTDVIELSKLKKHLKGLIFSDSFDELRKELNQRYPGFFTTYRKIDFRLKIVNLIKSLTEATNSIIYYVNCLNEIKQLFKEEDCQYYIEKVSILFTYKEPRKCHKFKVFYEDNKIKLVYAIIMAINEQNKLPFLSSLDLVILRTDQNLEAIVESDKDKDALLVNLLQDYINC